MPLSETLRRILVEYPNARTTPLEGNSLAQFIRGDAVAGLLEALGELRPGLVVQGSPGQGNWAVVPWLSVLDPAVTTTATRGYYVVYLFHSTQSTVHLSLNQGTTVVREEFLNKTREVLADRAELMRKRLFDFTELLPITKIDLGSLARLPGDYVAGHAIGATYNLGDLPDEEKLRGDLQAIVRAYRALTYRGGVEGDAETQSELADEFGTPAQTSIIEIRRYAYHRKIERNSTAAKNAKKFHGTRCQACELDFGERYGEIGKGFIEAHHLKPIGALEEGIPIEYNVASDFAVLCANCHRMIHRTDDPSDVQGFRNRIAQTKPA